MRLFYEPTSAAPWNRDAGLRKWAADASSATKESQPVPFPEFIGRWSDRLREGKLDPGEIGAPAGMLELLRLFLPTPAMLSSNLHDLLVGNLLLRHQLQVVRVLTVPRSRLSIRSLRLAGPLILAGVNHLPLLSRSRSSPS